MRKIRKKVIAGMLTAAMVIGSVFNVGAEVTAAQEKAICVPLSFSGDTWEDEYWNNSQTNIWNGIQDKVIFSDSYTVSFQVYIPKQVFQNEESAILVGAWMDLEVENGEDIEYIGTIDCTKEIHWYQGDGQYKATYWNEATDTDEDASEYASAQETGDYVILSVKNLPMADKMFLDEKEIAIDTTKSGYLHANVRIAGVNTKIDTVAYIDNLVVMAKGQELLSIDYSDSGKLSGVSYSVNNAEQETEAEIVDFSDQLLSLEKDSATVQVGKTVAISAVALPASEITYQSSDEKVATVNEQGVVKGMSAGTAVITVLANGVSREFTVTVKAVKQQLTLAKSSATIKKGKKVTIKATATPKAKITYQSSNKKVATVTSKGVVKGIKAGKAIITVSSNGVSKKFTVTVKK